MKRLIATVLLMATVLTLLAACGGGNLPNGRYEPAPGEFAVFEAIVVNGNNITMTYAMGAISQTNKYTYKNGTLTYQDGGTALNVACEYYDKTNDSPAYLVWSGIKYVKK